MRNTTQKRKTGGYTLIELLFYIALFFILTLTIVNSLITMTKAFNEVAIQADFIQSSSIIERISREIRQSYGINSISANSLTLNTKDESENNKTVQFSLSGYNLQFFDDSVFMGNLNNSNIQVTNLSFTNIPMANGVAIKVEVSLQSTRDPASRTESFYDTVVLRGSY